MINSEEESEIKEGLNASGEIANMKDLEKVFYNLSYMVDGNQTDSEIIA